MTWQKKKTPIIRGLSWFYWIKCFLVSTNLIKPLLHTYLEYAMFFFCVEGTNRMLLNCHMCQLCISEYLSIKVVNLQKKRPLFLEVLISFTKSSVSLFPLFCKTTPSHTSRIWHIFIFCESGRMDCYLTVTCASYVFQIFCHLKTP